MENNSRSFLQAFLKSWRVIRVPILGFIVAIAVGFVVLVIFRLPAAFEDIKTEEATEAAIEFIQSQKLTLEDVMGENLPPTPDPDLVDATSFLGTVILCQT